MKLANAKKQTKTYTYAANIITHKIVKISGGEVATMRPRIDY